MDFNDTPQEAEFRAEAQRWLAENAKPRTESGGMMAMFAEAEGEGGNRGDAEWEMVRQAQAWQKRKYDASWAGITWPKRYGGRGASIMQQVIWGQEEAKYETPPNIFMIGIGMAGPTIQVHGTNEQKDRYLKPMLSGEEIWCQLFSEPGAGSDLAGLRTRAVKEGDEWVVNGQKVWTSGAHYSRWGILVTRSDPTAPKHKGLTYFIVDMESPGIDIQPIRQMTGGANFNEVFFKDVRIPDSNRLGAVGQGWSVAITTLMNERMSIGGGGGMLGGDSGLSDVIKALGKVYVNGRPAIENAAVRQQLAHFMTRFKALELTGYRTLSALSMGGMPGSESSIMKLEMGLLAQQMGAFVMELQGPNGVLMDTDEALLDAMWQQVYLGVPAIRIAGGTDEVQRNIIGERVLGLPADVRLDKGVPFNEVPTGPRTATA